MHPEIEKFWKDAGYRLSNKELHISGVVTGYKETYPGSCVSIIEIISFVRDYRFKDKWYSEEEMLRIVRLKAFL
jgi:hypothetical protein